ncbi:hypothetical protein B0H16DRAFT_1477064 [Mycena metata]|uniref:Importin subunit beta-1/Transportin-1-like TPR repeats domain-containing protein n=1 Tax=Mycena metata TaxID=1033252 RepID=A0AAD7HAI2_9AGAR|nr:hypothetical protein B0H16DRAFT_1477064 [Mycena metata]
MREHPRSPSDALSGVSASRRCRVGRSSTAGSPHRCLAVPGGSLRTDSAYISLLAGAVQSVVPAVTPSIEAHIKSTNWHHREIAIVPSALSSRALIGPSSSLPSLPLIDIADSENDVLVATGPLSPYMDGVIRALLRVTERVVFTLHSFFLAVAGNEHNFRTAAYEASSAYLSGATADAVVQNTVVAVLTRMEQMLNMQNQILGIDDQQAAPPRRSHHNRRHCERGEAVVARDLNETCRLDMVKEIETNLEFVGKRIISAVITAIVAYHSAIKMYNPTFCLDLLRTRENFTPTYLRHPNRRRHRHAMQCLKPCMHIHCGRECNEKLLLKMCKPARGKSLFEAPYSPPSTLSVLSETSVLRTVKSCIVPLKSSNCEQIDVRSKIWRRKSTPTHRRSSPSHIDLGATRAGALADKEADGGGLTTQRMRQGGGCARA